MTGAVAWSALLILLLTLMIARSTATAAWVPGIDSVVMVALLGAVLMGLLAILPVPWPIGLGAGLLVGPLVALNASWSQLHSTHPTDPLSLGLVGAWWARFATGIAPGDPIGYRVGDDASFYLYLISLLMWITGGWLAWCVLRWRRPLLGLVPGVAAFATNLLNSANQNGYTLVILVLTLALLLWTNYLSSVANVNRARVRMTVDARWDFWESGLVAMAALIALAILLPPMSTTDRTVQMQASAFSSWAALQQRLNRPTAFGPGGGGYTGFATDVALGGALTRTQAIVFTYSYTSSSGPLYFRGVNETQTWNGEWRYPSSSPFQLRIPKDTSPPLAETYLNQARTAYEIDMLSPPAGNEDILFYPGTLVQTDRPTIASQSSSPNTFNLALTTIDRLSSATPPTSAGIYNMTTDYSIATVAQLEKAGTSYPQWLSSYSSLPASGYRTPEAITKISQLAQTIVKAANAVTPYDQATAIEKYLRTNYTYTLTPPSPPPGVDRLEFFLFDSKKGYCEFFASAMGDMLRSLGIPTQLVSGFGPGQFDANLHAYVVRDADAHTWVESYFPGYGWITFEPTPDTAGVYKSIPRGSVGPNTCTADTKCDPPPSGDLGPSPNPGVKPPVGGGAPHNPTSGGSGLSLRFPGAGTLSKILGVLLAFVLVLLAAAVRYLRPRSVTLAWRRALALARLAGAERRPGETPNELARRLASRFPEAADALRSLAEGFMVAAYAPPELAPSARNAVLEAWAALRPLLLRRVASRFHLTRA
ncbi:MAG TPA: transglutaminase domain-containing protein [Candidatus Acidoferrum sp.]|nr:transglutaminase domain-containing protein [Candidatus Acidoferrum sp.]